MNKTIEKYSYETDKIEKYEIIEIEEEVVVKKEKLKVSHRYYKRLSDDELFEPFENPDENIEKDYKLYREKHNFLSPEEIKATREMYKMNQRDFASLLGISYSNLSSIENGSIQTNYIDALVRLTQEPIAFKKLLINRKSMFENNIYEKYIGQVNIKIIESRSEYDEIANEIKEYYLDIKNNLIRFVNLYEYQSKNRMRETKWKKSQGLYHLFG